MGVPNAIPKLFFAKSAKKYGIRRSARGAGVL